MTAAQRVLVRTQLFLYAILGFCVHRNFSATAQSDGISFYGVTPATLPALSVGFLVAAGGLWYVGREFARRDASRWFVRGVYLEVVGLPLLLLTPFNQGAFFNWAHMTVGASMAVVSYALSLGILRQRVRPFFMAAVGLQGIGGVLSVCSLVPWGYHVLLQGEIILLVGFATTLFLSLGTSATSPRVTLTT